jgi:inorganic pyrophosphatase/exopolyphosphatase
MFTDIEAKDVKRLLLRVYKKYQSGEITESKAQKETYILNSVLKAIEVTDIEARLERIENLMKAQ